MRYAARQLNISVESFIRGAVFDYVRKIKAGITPGGVR
jgi:hypothetical protein